jgi:hypothetical protein
MRLALSGGEGGAKLEDDASFAPTGTEYGNDLPSLAPTANIIEDLD